MVTAFPPIAVLNRGVQLPIHQVNVMPVMSVTVVFVPNCPVVRLTKMVPVLPANIVTRVPAPAMTVPIPIPPVPVLQAKSVKRITGRPIIVVVPRIVQSAILMVNAMWPVPLVLMVPAWPPVVPEAARRLPVIVPAVWPV